MRGSRLYDSARRGRAGALLAGRLVDDHRRVGRVVPGAVLGAVDAVDYDTEDGRVRAPELVDRLGGGAPPGAARVDDEEDAVGDRGDERGVGGDRQRRRVVDDEAVALLGLVV